jgi:hypothetical protein
MRLGLLRTPWGNDLAGFAYLATACLFALAILIQTFLAGDAALLAPEMWEEHVAWIHIFQWISVVLPVFAHLAERRIGFTALNCLPMAMIGLQYVSIHLAIKTGDSTLVGLHALGGIVLFGTVVFIVQEWRYRRTAPLTSFESALNDEHSL